MLQGPLTVISTGQMSPHFTETCASEIHHAFAIRCGSGMELLKVGERNVIAPGMEIAIEDVGLKKWPTSCGVYRCDKLDDSPCGGMPVTSCSMVIMGGEMLVLEPSKAAMLCASKQKDGLIKICRCKEVCDC